MIFMSSAGFADKEHPHWAAVAGETPWTDYITYDTLAFTPLEHPQIRPLKGRGKQIFARLVFTSKDAGKTPYTYSLAEVENPEAVKQIIESDIPDLVRDGFDGIVLDMDHREKDLSLANKINLFMSLLSVHYPYLRVMISIPYDHVYDDELESADDVLINLMPDDMAKDEDLTPIIRNINSFSKMHPRQHVYVLLLGDVRDNAKCAAFDKHQIPCYATDYHWSPATKDSK